MGAPGRADLLDLLGPAVTRAGLDLEDVEITPAGRRRLLRILVDKDGGVGLDEVAAVSTAVSAVLDGSDVMGGAPYVLEVSSPGVGRPLTEPRHWRRARGRLVRTVLTEGGELTGRVLDVDEAGVVLEVPAPPGDARHLRWEELARGLVQVEFTRPTGAETPAGPDRPTGPAVPEDDEGAEDEEDEEVQQWTST